MGYNKTLNIEEDVLRLLKASPNMTATDIAIRLQTTENHVKQGISHLRKNVLKSDEAIITHYKKKMSTGKDCEYELLTQTTSRIDAMNQVNRVIKKNIRGLREITKLNNMLATTTNKAQIQQIKMQIHSIMTKLAVEFNLANLGLLPNKNEI